MNRDTESALPSAPEFATLQPKELLDRLVDLEDRAPMELINACAAHGETMVKVLHAAIDDEDTWSDDPPGIWWLPLHAAFILGRIPSEPAGLLLVHAMRCLNKHDEQNLQDWLAGDWPALFANKPPSSIEAAREFAEDRSLDWYMRCQGVDVILHAGLRQGGQALEDAVDWAAALARDEWDEWTFRVSAACDLLDFPRSRHRVLLETMARDEARHQAASGDSGVVFDVDDIQLAFARGVQDPAWLRRNDPWEFYSPDAITRRQERWQKEDEDSERLDLDWDAPPPYIRPTPKIGRNEPCPCGSGKKYKRCCLAKDEASAREDSDIVN